ncbi:alpha/beta hydrolase family protein [Sorangium sp. So ce388]|uniref:alpha/beta hydrolase family protein n=1 Tax=Sorangium sp. So ce388 TaxID=3133309 RepID=UPI003F5CA278
MTHHRSPRGLECSRLLVALGLGLGAVTGGCLESAAPGDTVSSIAAEQGEAALPVTRAHDEHCAPPGSGKERSAKLEALAEDGPYGFATRDFVFVDDTRPTPPNDTFPGAPSRTLPARVWYPARRPTAASPPPGERVPVACGGPFPLLAYAHGLTSLGDNARFFAEHLATHGYISVEPLLPLTNGNAPGGPTIGDVPNQPADLAFVMRQVAALGGDDADLGAAVDPERRAVMGLSAGGLVALLGAYHPVLKIEGIQAAVAMAPLSCFLGAAIYTRPLPTLILAGTSDELVPIAGPRRAFENAPPPVTLVELTGGIHSGFMARETPFVANTDTLECARLQSAGPGRGGAALAAGIINGVGPGAFDPTGCTPLCSQRYTQTMGATRQLKLARAATLAHLEASLKGREAVNRRLLRELAEEAQDVQVQTKR